MVSRTNRWVRAVVWSWGPYVLFAAGVFLVLAVLGAAVGAERTAAVVPLRAPGDPVPDQGVGYFLARNGLVALLMAAGWLFGGLPTVFLLGYNGFLLGGVAADAAGTYGVARTAALLLPHGVFEVPAFWLAGAIGFRLTHVGWRVASGNGADTSVARHLVQALAAAVVVLALLAAAAVVEAELTLALADALTRPGT